MTMPLRARRRAACLGLAALVGLAAAGCGDGDSADRDAAAQAAREYVAAFTAGEGERACALMTDEVRAAFEQADEAESCPEAVEEAHGRTSEEERRLLRQADISVEEVEGDVARARIRVDPRNNWPVEIRRVEGRWLFATPPQG